MHLFIVYIYVLVVKDLIKFKFTYVIEFKEAISFAKNVWNVRWSEL